MPARSISTATISFGLVSVPVNVYSSAESKSSVSFNMLHKKCSGRLKQQYICPRDNNEVVTRDDMVKGYEFAKDQYVVLTPEELKALEEKATSTIEIRRVGLSQFRHQVGQLPILSSGGQSCAGLRSRAIAESGSTVCGASRTATAPARALRRSNIPAQRASTRPPVPVCPMPPQQCR